MLFSIRLHRGSLDTFCAPAGLALVSSLRVDVAHLAQLTLSSMYPYDWLRFFRHPMPGRSSSARSQRSPPSASVTQPIQIIAASDERATPARLCPNLRVRLAH